MACPGQCPAGAAPHLTPVLGRRLFVVGKAGIKNGILAIREGLVYGTLNQSPSADAKQGLQLALDIVGVKDLPERRHIIPMPKITRAHADQFGGEW